MLMQKVFLFFATIILLAGCYNDNASELYPSAIGSTLTCDTSAVITYVKHVSQILGVSCVNCHTSSAPAGGVALDNYNDVKRYANTGQLLGALKHANAFKPMPPNTQLDTCYIGEIERWVNAGATNN